MPACDMPFDCAPSELACDLVSLVGDFGWSSCGPSDQRRGRRRGRGDPHLDGAPHAPPLDDAS